jgi:hypothetical protein
MLAKHFWSLKKVMPTPQSEQIQILNQITKMIDDRVTKYKKEMKTMPTKSILHGKENSF